jgi:hypothetical protein
MLKHFPEFKDREEMRKVIGRYGISGKAQVGNARCMYYLAQSKWWLVFMNYFLFVSRHPK